MEISKRGLARKNLLAKTKKRFYFFGVDFYIHPFAMQCTIYMKYRAQFFPFLDTDGMTSVPNNQRNLFVCNFRRFGIVHQETLKVSDDTRRRPIFRLSSRPFQ